MNELARIAVEKFQETRRVAEKQQRIDDWRRFCFALIGFFGYSFDRDNLKSRSDTELIRLLDERKVPIPEAYTTVVNVLGGELQFVRADRATNDQIMVVIDSQTYRAYTLVELGGLIVTNTAQEGGQP